MIKEIRKNPMYAFLIMLVVATSIGFQSWRTIFNNYAVNQVGVNSFQIGVIQAIREVPGFIALLVVYLLLVIKEHRLAGFSVFVMGFGVLLTGVLPSFFGLVLTTLIMSLGFHYFETVNQSLTLQYFTKEQTPIMIGKAKSVGALSNVIVGVVIWATSHYFALSWHFIVAGIIVMVFGLVSFKTNPTKKTVTAQQKKMVLKKKYWLFYVLNFLSGARRQIFVVFAVFMLVEKYNFQVKEIAILFVINNIITYFIAPIVAKGINRFGERVILSLEYSFLIIVFLSYAYIENRTVVSVLYVADHIFFSAAMAVNTFFRKIGEPQDVAPSMAVGFTINHISAVIIPVIGGALWMINWRIPFVAGALISLCSLLFSQKVPSEIARLSNSSA